jgi:hypothetical protein
MGSFHSFCLSFFRGLKVVGLHLPELALLRAAHSASIASEMRNNMAGEWGLGRA